MRDGREGGGMRNSAVSAEGGDTGGWEDWMEAGTEDHMQVDTDREVVKRREG